MFFAAAEQNRRAGALLVGSSSPMRIRTARVQLTAPSHGRGAVSCVWGQHSGGGEKHTHAHTHCASATAEAALCNRATDAAHERARWTRWRRCLAFAAGREGLLSVGWQLTKNCSKIASSPDKALCSSLSRVL